MYSSIETATLFEKATASTTVLAPVTTSPEANHNNFTGNHNIRSSL